MPRRFHNVSASLRYVTVATGKSVLTAFQWSQAAMYRVGVLLGAAGFLCGVRGLSGNSSRCAVVPVDDGKISGIYGMAHGAKFSAAQTGCRQIGFGWSAWPVAPRFGVLGAGAGRCVVVNLRFSQVLALLHGAKLFAAQIGCRQNWFDWPATPAR